MGYGGISVRGTGVLASRYEGIRFGVRGWYRPGFGSIIVKGTRVLASGVREYSCRGTRVLASGVRGFLG